MHCGGGVLFSLAYSCCVYIFLRCGRLLPGTSSTCSKADLGFLPLTAGAVALLDTGWPRSSRGARCRSALNINTKIFTNQIAPNGHRPLAVATSCSTKHNLLYSPAPAQTAQPDVEEHLPDPAPASVQETTTPVPTTCTNPAPVRQKDASRPAQAPTPTAPPEGKPP